MVKDLREPVDSPLWKNQTEFRIMERRCKRKGPFDSAIYSTLETRKVGINLWNRELEAELYDDHQGFFIIRNALPIEMQVELVENALQDWAKPPNTSNLDMHFKLNPMGIWNQYNELKRHGSVEPIIEKRNFDSEQVNSSKGHGLTVAGGQNVEFCELSKENMSKSTEYIVDEETKLAIDKPVDNMLDKSDSPITKVLPRMRWLTLGHQYDWTKKEYHLDRKPPFPIEFAEITKDIVKAIECITNYSHTLWKPEAGIVNFYQPGDSLTAHQDRSELTAEAPLLSISIGLECVFLFGTTNRNDKPVALKLESGDLVVMYGAGRLAFHGVPLVFPNTLPQNLSSKLDPIMADYMSHTRINLNIRQVY